LSQKQLGLEVGFEESGASARMNQYERGKHRPDTQTIERLCEVLNLPVAYLYCDDDDLARVIANYSHLGRSDKNKILKLIERVED